MYHGRLSLGSGATSSRTPMSSSAICSTDSTQSSCISSLLIGTFPPQGSLLPAHFSILTLALLPAHFSLFTFPLLPAPRLAQQSWMDDLRPPKAQSQSLVTSVFGGTLQVGIQFPFKRKFNYIPAERRDVPHLQDVQQEAGPLPWPVHRYTSGQIRREGRRYHWCLLVTEVHVQKSCSSPKDKKKSLFVYTRWSIYLGIHLNMITCLC